MMNRINGLGPVIALSGAVLLSTSSVQAKVYTSLEEAQEAAMNGDSTISWTKKYGNDDNSSDGSTNDKPNIPQEKASYTISPIISGSGGGIYGGGLSLQGEPFYVEAILEKGDEGYIYGLGGASKLPNSNLAIGGAIRKSPQGNEFSVGSQLVFPELNFSGVPYSMNLGVTGTIFNGLDIQDARALSLELGATSKITQNISANLRIGPEVVRYSLDGTEASIVGGAGLVYCNSDFSLGASLDHNGAGLSGRVYLGLPLGGEMDCSLGTQARVLSLNQLANTSQRVEYKEEPEKLVPVNVSAIGSGPIIDSSGNFISLPGSTVAIEGQQGEFTLDAHNGPLIPVNVTLSVNEPYSLNNSEFTFIPKLAGSTETKTATVTGPNGETSVAQVSVTWF